MFLAAVMVSAMAGQAVEARDHDGWRNQQRAWRNYNRNLQRQQRQLQRQQRWNNNTVFRNIFPSGINRNNPNLYINRRPWDNAHDNAIRALQEQRAAQAAQQRFMYPYGVNPYVYGY